MDIFLKSHNGDTKFIFCLMAAFLLSVSMVIAYHIAKSYVDSEINKLNTTKNNFDKFIIVFSGAITSAMLIIACMLISNLALSCYYHNFEEILFPYMKLVMAFSTIAITCYTLMNPKNANQRIIDIPHKEAKIICSKLNRILVVSFIYSMIHLLVILLFVNIKHRINVEYFFIGIIIIYYFTEIFLSRRIMFDLLKITTIDKESISAKLISFVNKKIPYLCLICMFFMIITDNSKNESQNLLFIKWMTDIYLLLFGIFVFQCMISFLLNKFLKHLKSLMNAIMSDKLIAKREKNLIWICDVVVLSIYVFVLCLAISYYGIDIKKYNVYGNVVTVCFILFITTVLFKGFQEYREIIIEKAAKCDTEHYGKLKSFMPAITAVFYILLFSTSTMVALSSIGINITPILASFSIFGAAIGLSATDIIKSFLHGIVLLMERNIFVGDFVQINGMTGIIEKLSVRVIYLRDVDGKINIIPYSNVSAIANYSKGYIVHSSILPLVSPDDIELAKKMLEQIVHEMREEDRYKNIIISNITIHGVKQIELTGLKIWWEITTTTAGKYIPYEIYNRLVLEFKKHNINLPKIENISISH